MYLVHLHVRPRRRGDVLPGDTARVIEACAAGLGGIEYVTVHGGAQVSPVVGVFVRAPTLEVAKAAGEQAWWCAWLAEPRLRSWELLCARVPRLPPVP